MISLDQWLSSGGDVRKKGKWERKLSPFYLKTQTNNNKKNPYILNMCKQQIHGYF